MNGDLDEAVPCPASPVGDGQDEGTVFEDPRVPERASGQDAVAAEPATAGHTKAQPNIEERTERSFRVYLEVLDTAEWLRRQFAMQLESFDLTIDGLRLLEILHREGSITTEDFCKRRRCRRQSLDALLKPLEEREWVRYEVIELEPTEIEVTQLAKKLRERPRRGRRMGRVSLTEAGEKFMRVVLPRHAKLVFAFMKALSGKEQETLSRACRKLREGDVVKMLDEIMTEEE
jgi:DNA-binding MarR family transcriptional regulator